MKLLLDRGREGRGLSKMVSGSGKRLKVGLIRERERERERSGEYNKLFIFTIWGFTVLLVEWYEHKY